MTKKKQQSVNWEKLCHQLQQALAAEMKESQMLQARLDKISLLALKHAGVIEYLEDKLAECMDMVDGNKPV